VREGRAAVAMSCPAPDQLTALQVALVRANAPVAQALAPGAGQKELDEVEGLFEFRLPMELRQLWAWHNGVVSSVITTAAEAIAMSLFPGGPVFLSARQSATKYRDYRQALAEVAPSLDPPRNDPDYLFHPRWVPIFAETTGDFVCDCSGGDAGPILYVEQELPEIFVPQVPSLHDLLAWLTEAYDCGAWTLDERGNWQEDRAKIPQGRSVSASYLF
jgi:cell wall assembly regulator SMI1